MDEKHVALFYTNPATRLVVEQSLPKNEYRVLAFDISRESIPPGAIQRVDAVLSEFEDETEAEVRIAWLRGMELLSQAPLLALSRVDDVECEKLALAAGADAFIPLPSEAALLRARIEAACRAASRASETARRRFEITGALRDVEPLKLLKFCEDRRLSGRLTVKTPMGQRWLEFLGGELVHSGGDASDGQDHLDAFLAAREGTFLVEQTPLEAGALVPAAPAPAPQSVNEAPQPSATPATSLMPSGRLSIVKEAPHLAPYHVQTEGDNRPSFTVTTLVTRDGRVVRKTRTAWQHPLLNAEDLPLAQSQLDRQHERIVAKIRELAAAAEAPAQPAPPSSVNGVLLGWAMHFIVEQVWAHLGTAVTTAILRRTHANLIPRFPVLKLFRVWVEGRVDFDIAQGPTLPLEAVEAVARWCAVFLATAQKLAPQIERIQLRQTTVLMEHALEQVGFYAAFDRACSEFPSKPGVPSADNSSRVAQR